MSPPACLRGRAARARARRRARLRAAGRARQPGLTNGGLELLERRGVDVAARLIRVGADVGDRQLDETPFALRFLARGPQQGFEAPAETTATCDGFRHAGTSGSGFAAGGAGGGEFAALCSTRLISSCATAR